MTPGCAEVDDSPRTEAAGGSRAAAQTVCVIFAADAAFRAPCCLAKEPHSLRDWNRRLGLAHVAVPGCLVAFTPGCAEVDDSSRTVAAGGSRAAAQTVGIILAADAAIRAPCCLAKEPCSLRRRRLVIAHVAVPGCLVAFTPGCAEVDDSPRTVAAGASRAAAQTVGVSLAADAAIRAPCCLAKEPPPESLLRILRRLVLRMWSNGHLQRGDVIRLVPAGRSASLIDKSSHGVGTCPERYYLQAHGVRTDKKI